MKITALTVKLPTSRKILPNSRGETLQTKQIIIIRDKDLRTVKVS